MVLLVHDSWASSLTSLHVHGACMCVASPDALVAGLHVHGACMCVASKETKTNEQNFRSRAKCMAIGVACMCMVLACADIRAVWRLALRKEWQPFWPGQGVACKLQGAHSMCVKRERHSMEWALIQMPTKEVGRPPPPPNLHPSC